MSDLSLDAISVNRGRRTVLDGIDAHFPTGSLTVVIGPNGAGKSTLLDVAAGLLRPDGGSVMLGGRLLSAIPRAELAARRAYLPQSPRVDWPIRVGDVVALGLMPALPAFGPLPADVPPRVAVALDRYDLAQLADRSATHLSGGELARVMLARATIADPKVLIVDEPTAGLDPRHALDAARRLRTLADAGCTVIVALHDLDLALRIADHALALRDGRVVAAGDASAVFTDDVLGGLYDIAVRVRRDGDGATVRFVA